MSPNNKRLKLLEASHEAAIEFDNLSKAKQYKFHRLRGRLADMVTDEDANHVLEFLNASPEFAKVVHHDYGTLLRRACLNRMRLLGIIQSLVERFPKALEIGDYDGDLPLHDACRSASLVVVQYLVEHYPKALKQRNSAGWLPLHCSFSLVGFEPCSLDVIQYLVEQYPEALEARCNDGALPLHWACRNANCTPEILCYLLEQYPNAQKQEDSRGKLPLHYCIWCFKEHEINYLNLLDRMRLLLPGYPVAINVAPHFHQDDDDDDVGRSFWSTLEEHGRYKEVSGLLLEEISLQDQFEWAGQVVEVLSLIDSSIGVETACLWAQEWQNVCREPLNEIETRLAALRNLFEDESEEESEEELDEEAEDE